MLRPLVRLETDVLVMNRAIVLLDDAGDYGAVGEDWLSLAPNCLVAVSAGATDHYAAVTVEVWSVAPPPQQDWESGKAGRLRLDSGYLEIQPTDTHVVRVGPPGWYEVRAYAAGRAEIAARTPRSGIHELRGVERFLFQFWPVPTLPARPSTDGGRVSGY